MALRNQFQRLNDIDLTDAHIELARFDLRPLQKNAYLVWQIWQSRDVAEAGEAPLHELRHHWQYADLVAVHQLLKASSKKGLLELIQQIEQHAKESFLVNGEVSPTCGGIDADDTNPLA